MSENKYSKTRIITECAIMIAIGTILAQIKLFRMPMGGSVTLCSMVPFILISYRHGMKWGLISGFVNSLLQMVLGGVYTPPAGTVVALIGSIFFDYILAYMVLGLASVFSKINKQNYSSKSVIFGTLFVCFLRFFCAFISGFLIWGSLTDGVWGAVSYSFVYNASYMIPESILTLIVILLLFKKAPLLFRV